MQASRLSGFATSCKAACSLWGQAWAFIIDLCVGFEGFNYGGNSELKSHDALSHLIACDNHRITSLLMRRMTTRIVHILDISTTCLWRREAD